MASVTAANATSAAYTSAPYVINVAVLFGGWVMGLFVVRNTGSTITAFATKSKVKALPAGFGISDFNIWTRRAMDLSQVAVIVLVPVVSLIVEWISGSRPTTWELRALLIALAIAGLILGVAVWQANPERYGAGWKKDRRFPSRWFCTPTSWLVAGGIIANALAIYIAISITP